MLYEILDRGRWNYCSEGATPEEALAKWRDSMNSDRENTGRAEFPTPYTTQLRDRNDNVFTVTA